MGLSEQDAAILDFERQWWKVPGAKEQAIADRFGMTSTAFYQRLNRLVDDPAAAAAEPMVVKRLRRIRDARGNRILGGGQ